jgi:hypothetical protein
MQNCSKRIQAFFLFTLIVTVSCGTSVFAKDCDSKSRKDPGLMTADVALARPVGAVATVTGFALFLVASPFAALGGNTQEAWDSLVVSPADYTFKRPLGHFDCEQPPDNK